MKGLRRQQILDALARLGELAQAHSIELEMCFYGGCAMMLAFDRRAITRDVDAIFHPRDAALPWIAQVAREQELPDDWLNDDVRQFLAPVGARRQLAMDLPGIKVSVPTSGYLLAMKALAGRRALPGYKGDEEDLRFLIGKMGIRSFEEVQEQIDRYYPDDRPSDAARALICRIIGEENTK